MGPLIYILFLATNLFFAHELLFFLPTNLTNLHESFSMNKKATYSVARIFTNTMIALTHIISVIRATEQVALNL